MILSPRHSYGRLRITVLSLVTLIAVSASAFTVDADDIKKQTNDPASKYYYPALLEKFMSNDTTLMTDLDYHYFYYGTMYTEDYNPYRENPFEKEVAALHSVYLKREYLTRNERRRVESLARKILGDNPLDLRQMMYLTYVFEANEKVNLAKIWRKKLNSLLLTIARSGSGADPENARVVVYPRHEFDFFNLSGLTVSSQQFVEPYYDKLTIVSGTKKNPKTTEQYFNLRYLLDQYYAKHPGEDPNLNDAPNQASDDEQDVSEE